MCYLVYLDENNKERSAICVAHLPENVEKITFKNKLLRSRDPSIVDWMELVEKEFSIELENGWWKVDHLNRNQLHLAVVLVRQTVESVERPKYGKTSVKNPLKLRPRPEDPLTKFLHLTNKNTFEWAKGHGLADMAYIMRRDNISFETVTLKKAIDDLKNSRLGINTSWFFGENIGLVKHNV